MPHGATLPVITSSAAGFARRSLDGASKTDWQRFEPRLHIVPASPSSDRSIVSRFIDTIPATLDELALASQSRDVEAMRRAAERIRELAASVGGLRVATLATQASAAGDDTEYREELLCELRRSATELHSALLDHA